MTEPNQIRINELARELEVKAKAIIDYLPEAGVSEKKTHSSSIEVAAAEKVRKHFRELADAEAAAEAAAAAEKVSREAAAKAARMRPPAPPTPAPAAGPAKPAAPLAGPPGVKPAIGGVPPARLGSPELQRPWQRSRVSPLLPNLLRREPQRPSPALRPQELLPRRLRSPSREPPRLIRQQELHCAPGFPSFQVRGRQHRRAHAPALRGRARPPRRGLQRHVCRRVPALRAGRCPCGPASGSAAQVPGLCPRSFRPRRSPVNPSTSASPQPAHGPRWKNALRRASASCIRCAPGPAWANAERPASSRRRLRCPANRGRSQSPRASPSASWPKSSTCAPKTC